MSVSHYTNNPTMSQKCQTIFHRTTRPITATTVNQMFITATTVYQMFITTMTVNQVFITATTVNQMFIAATTVNQMFQSIACLKLKTNHKVQICLIRQLLHSKQRKPITHSVIDMVWTAENSSSSETPISMYNLFAII